MSIFVLSRQWAGTVNRPKAPSVTKCVKKPKGLDAGRKPCYSMGMKNEIAVPIYSSLEALLAAEVPTLRDRCLALAGRT